MKKLEGKVAIVTGASGGIGRAITKELTEEGCTVIGFNYVPSNEGIEYVLDITNRQAVEEAVKDVIGKYGRIDILINNAGITKDNLVYRMSYEDWDAVINTNLTGAFNMVKACIREIVKNEGVIINVSSVVGLEGNIGQVNYSASKAGLVGLTKSLAKEFGRKNVRVNAIAPGFIETPMTEKLPEEIKKAALEKISMRRFGKPEEVAKLVRFLVTDGTYINGQVIVIDGGMEM
ncbi:MULTISPECIES: 3-oxoacyl-ACP reductase FabG [Fervidobacterium]|uniref:Short-chain dehydrogenase/reductase SDR n=1 Tax=Fervidobacterium nodosum (strain ATCC 35602 / DSM 5306 / Rt17-B1) TaxID=381764 RepID=A7HKN1_FERNB|nr:MULTISPECIES: 3-oxoacyl-ACP reductase FabG [Fervidobacterium]ABS60464.1 short-chain dehydrogenase/reductase SDR [Fervidobacterium nodosum Rt17-B1]KAF2962570.1 beta-ketoacyl-ACP reductase [Fervidobacterium sp. 2310opik-2]PHJ14549.1 3-ketoacyl-ACP reductase [Fervidobacterium sp. SC_NGM5_G05]